MSHTTALIIEDDRSLAQIFASAFKMADFKTEVKYDGQDALNYLKESVPELILLDLHLPTVPGTVILEEIRQDDRFDNTTIILATADPLMARRIESGREITLIKPISFVKLRQLASELN